MPDTIDQAPPPVFTQHPDSLFKKSDRNKPTTEPPALDPEVVAEEQKTLDQIKAELPSLLFGEKKKEPSAEDKAKVEAAKVEAEKVEAAKVAAEAEAAKTEEQKAEEAKAVAEAAEKKTRVRRAPDALEVARETGRAIVEGLRKGEVPDPTAPAPTVKPTDHLSSEDKDTYELFKTLSDTDPKYKGKHDEFLSFVKKAASYRKRWEKDHPGTAFDQADTEHEDFYEANQPQFAEADLDRARVRREASAEVQRQLEDQKKDYERRISEIEERSVGPEVSRQAVSAADRAVGDFIANLPDEGLRAATKEADKLKENDPLAFDVLDREAAVLRQEVAELHNIIHRQNYFKPENPLHQHLAKFVNHQEASIKQLPLEQQVFEGRRFATRDEYASMTPQQRQQSWMLSEQDVVGILTKSCSARATKVIATERKKLEDQAVRYGFVKGSAAVTPQATPPAKPAAAAPAAHRPAAPSAPTGGALPPTSAPGKAADMSTEKSLVNTLW